MKNLLYLFTLFILITSCTLFKKDYPEIAHAITLRTAKQLAHEKKMRLVGTSGGMIGQVNSLGMFLKHNSSSEVLEARKLALFVADRFLYNINSDEKVRPYLNNYPFKIEDLEIFIGFPSTDLLHSSPEKIDHIVISNGTFKYKIFNKETQLPDTILLEETIAEAREKVSNMTNK